MKMKKLLGLGAAAAILITGVTACTPDSPDTNNKNEEGTVQEQGKEENNNDSNAVAEAEDSKYVNYIGKVNKSEAEEGNQLTVDGEGEDNGLKGISFNISGETVIVSDKTQEVIGIKEIQEGDTLEVIYSKDSPMTKSLPPITNAEAVVLREEKDNQNMLGVKLSSFDKDMISEDNSLQLNITDDTAIVDLEGKELTKEDIIDKEVLVFFGPAETLSMPGQSNAEKIILL